MHGLKIALAVATISLAGVTAAALPSGTAQAASPSFCANYARDAVNKQRTNLRRRCNFRGSRWQLNYRNHFRWCLRSTSAAVRREARARNVQLRTCRRPGACPRIYRPVCGLLRGQRRTYSNSCVARNAGARIVGQGQCRTQVQCPAIYRPVCGIRNGRRQTYSNACVARRSGAQVVAQGQCQAGGGGCNRYIAQALKIVAAIRQKRCIVPGTFFYSSSRATQRQVCQARTPNQRGGVLNSMRGYLQRCQPQGAACARYVRQALGIVRAIRNKGCRVPGGYFYSANPSTQRQVCRQRTVNQRGGVLNSMRGYLQRCQP